MHTELKIVKGVQIAPGDLESAESGYTVINLLSGSASGFALEPETGWDPALPESKSGLWAENDFNDGRTLIASGVQNVTETIRVTLTAPSLVVMSQYIIQFDRMAKDVVQYWETEGVQIQPVFLWWHATGAPGPQYALIYRMELSVSAPSLTDAGVIVRDCVIVLEREPYWRGIPPGANPVLWTLYTKNLHPGSGYDYERDLVLVDDGTYPPLHSLASQTVQNRAELNLADADYISNNRFTIPAASIPGDAPALVQLAVDVNRPGGDTDNYSLFVSHISDRDFAVAGRSSRLYRFVSCYPVLRSTGVPAWSTVTVNVASDTGGVQGYSSVAGHTGNKATPHRAELTPTTTMQDALVFTSDELGMNVQRGRFAVFVRCRQNSGAFGDIEMQLRATYRGPRFLGVETPVVRAPLLAGTGDTSRYPVLYLGTIELPPDSDAYMETGGLQGGTGLNNAQATLSLVLRIKLANAFSAALLYVADLVFMPYDEAFVDIVPIPPDTATAYKNLTYDNTGYATRGKPYAVGREDGGQSGFVNVAEVSGADLMLEPGVDNTLWFLHRNASNQSNVRGDMDVTLNIVPRWRYVRDV